MIRHIAIAAIGITSFAVAFGSGGCSHRDALSFDLPPEAGGASFTNLDAGVGEPDADLIAYCPATSCPAPYTGCPGSRFECDVNLMTDPDNCGACGLKCPAQVSGINAGFACISGKCVMTCAQHTSFDGNGIVDDGCETPLGTNENCNDPGDTCPDPEKPCVWTGLTQSGRCGCAEPGFIVCSSSVPPCVDPKTNDAHCGGCGNTCSPTGDGGPLRTNTYYGCVGGECGHLKCTANHGDCDGDAENGCEADLLSPSSCGACNNVCAPGQSCLKDPDTGAIACGCAPGQTLCGKRCVDLGSHPQNCGGCGIDCTLANKAHGFGLCKFGACEFGCMEGWGDCNGDPKDACETNFDSDPRNCGGCGIACEIGQPCIAGRCAVEPCGPGGPTK